ncbi:Hypothetical Protein RRSL_04198 [Ralstonia solanacearum UW551]|uniref:Uncharacterized protein n=4 Tax=Ralstonia TaxID=48736 RepID=A0ABF7RBF1_RALSL|nr:hypothetical protein RSUY_22240 [Ralstonia solanacearum]EAP74252.1 Hypothetical Protein RRSL_04198 [Ralstonia solanacearum UW551]CEJ18885.1 hypothetical protein RSIPO_04887 [Ralstonia solanacearum IPO1609]
MLSRDGFLSPDVDTLANQVPSGFPCHTTLMERVNRFAVALLIQPRDIFQRDADLLAVTSLSRAVQDFEAAVILAARGLRAQSRSMARSAFETALYCAAASRDLLLSQGARLKPKKGDEPTTSFFDAFEGGHQRFRVQVATDLREMPGVTTEQSAAAEALLDEIGAPGKHQDIDLRGLAEDLNLGDLYTVIYRQLSQDAHPSATSLQHHLILNASGKIEGLQIGPDYTQYADTVVLAICSLLVALNAFVERLGTPNEAAEVKELVNTYCQLHEVPETL